MNALQHPPTEPAVSIPENTLHAVSVSLPLWKYNIAYEEGEPEISEAIKSGYPRFKIHYKIEELCALLEKEYGMNTERSMLFPTPESARRCRKFINLRHPNEKVRVVQLSKNNTDAFNVKLSVVFFPAELFPVAKQYWQHTGEGVSSRHAQYFLEQLVNEDVEKVQQTESSLHVKTQPQELFVEERFGRYLSPQMANEAKPAVKRRIAEEIQKNSGIPVKYEDIYLYSTGMTAIFSAYRLVMQVNAEKDKAVCFGFPYTDTLKILEKFGPGCLFFPFGDDEGDLAKLEKQLEEGLKISSLFCEVPTNPLLNTPNLVKIRELANKYKFIVAVDDTVGNMANLNTLKYADVCVSSLTKLFSGDCNVMGGELVLNPLMPFYKELSSAIQEQYVDAFWAEDAIYLERNSRDFYARNQRINKNAEAVVSLLQENQKKFDNKLIKKVNYPSCNSSKANYDALKHKNGGYGGLLSVIFHQKEAAIAFFDNLFIAKGPSLGTNFTLGCPYTIIAHYNELPFVNECGVDTYLVRISVGLEEPEDLRQRFQAAIDAANRAVSL